MLFMLIGIWVEIFGEMVVLVVIDRFCLVVWELKWLVLLLDIEVVVLVLVKMLVEVVKVGIGGFDVCLLLGIGLGVGKDGLFGISGNGKCSIMWFFDVEFLKFW